MPTLPQCTWLLEVMHYDLEAVQFTNTLVSIKARARSPPGNEQSCKRQESDKTRRSQVDFIHFGP